MKNTLVLLIDLRQCGVLFSFSLSVLQRYFWAAVWCSRSVSSPYSVYIVIARVLFTNPSQTMSCVHEAGHSGLCDLLRVIVANRQICSSRVLVQSVCMYLLHVWSIITYHLQLSRQIVRDIISMSILVNGISLTQTLNNQITQF